MGRAGAKAAKAEAAILAVNAGSSSIKFALFETSTPLRRMLDGRIERIGLSEPSLIARGPGPNRRVSRTVTAPDHAAASQILLDWLFEEANARSLTAVGHRFVHGGPAYSKPERITKGMLARLQQLRSYDPEHLPAEIALAETLHSHLPETEQIACFDTAFHHDMPRVARLLPIPRRYDAMGIRRYGFHGLSYAFLLQELERRAGATAANGRVVLAHLGNGASLAAVRQGRGVDTTMAFTPASGLMMGTRCGDVDPGLVAFLMGSKGMTAAQFELMANHRSGLLGVSETSSDMRDLLAMEATDIRAAEAIDMFCYQARKSIGAYAAALGGIDTLVFAGGIGENCAQIRARICGGLSFLGIELDESCNVKHADVISTQASRAIVRVIPTDEEIMIAKYVCRVLGIVA